MTEIRPIRKEEAVDFLRLLCSVFGLDYSRANDVFFNEPLFSLERKWALFVHGEMTSILTTTPLQFGWGKAAGIAGVATLPSRQRCGYASKLLKHVLEHGRFVGEEATILFARDETVYNRNGFQTLDHVLRATLPEGRPEDEPSVMEFERVRAIYEQWSSADKNRLVRDAKRWRYWLWHYRACSPLADGYVAHEPGCLREAVLFDTGPNLDFYQGTEWYGTATVSNTLQLPVKNARKEMFMMGYRCPGIPQMFMTDQF